MKGDKQVWRHEIRRHLKFVTFTYIRVVKVHGARQAVSMQTPAKSANFMIAFAQVLRGLQIVC
nr:MAG TPA: hypothetical protein [Caudoviricetes sp.]